VDSNILNYLFNNVNRHVAWRAWVNLKFTLALGRPLPPNSKYYYSDQSSKN